MSNATHLRGSAQWIRFPRVVCESWVHWTRRQAVPVVLMGDAAHTAHFSIGSGTKLALEDAIELARCIGRIARTLRGALATYEEVRSVEVLRIQNAARNSTEWFENVERYAISTPEQFAYSLLTRSQRISTRTFACATAVSRGIRGLVRRARVRASGARSRQLAHSADVHAVHAARRDPEQPRRRVADGAVLVRRRHARRLSSRASRRARDGRRRARLSPR